REARRHDADESSRHAVEDETAAEDLRIAVEAPSPRLVRQHEDRGRAGLRILGRQPAPEERRDAEESKRVRRDEPAVELLGPLARCPEHVFVAAADHVTEDVVLFLIIEELENPESGAPAGPVAARVMNLDHRDAVRVDVWEGIEKDVLDD